MPLREKEILVCLVLNSAIGPQECDLSLLHMQNAVAASMSIGKY